LPTTVDLTGLPEPVIRDVLRLVQKAREQQSGNGTHAPPPDSGTPPGSAQPNSAEEWVDRWRAWVASHPRRELTMDDSRESIYEGCGE
jgi:hypothetical protein